MIGKFKIKGIVSTSGAELTSEITNRVLILDSSKRIRSSNITTTTLGYLDATSSIQTQLNNKSNVGHTHVLSNITDYIKPFQLYTSSGVYNGTTKVWVGTTTVTSNGKWTVNYSTAGFTNVLNIQCTAQATGETNVQQNYASVLMNTITTSGCSGMCSNSNTTTPAFSTARNQFSANGTTIIITVIGI